MDACRPVEATGVTHQLCVAGVEMRFVQHFAECSRKDDITNGYNIPVLGIFQGSYGMPRTFVATLEYRFW